ncbi:hypothetical protein cypCar_00016095 [Cyprinus carpio]|nr:hypothetical protein cypCar_00016095 [Cyprinus carpio]
MLTFVFVCLSISLTGLHAAFTVVVASPSVKVKENEGVDLKCAYTADFGATPRIEWKFKDLKGYQFFIYFAGMITAEYAGRITVYDGGLRFNKVTRADSGDYDCEVSGNSGYDEKTIKLTVLDTLYLQNWFLCVIRSSRAYLNWTLVHIFVRPLMEKVLLSVEMQCTWKSVSYIVIAFK